MYLLLIFRPRGTRHAARGTRHALSILLLLLLPCSPPKSGSALDAHTKHKRFKKVERHGAIVIKKDEDL